MHSWASRVALFLITPAGALLPAQSGWSNASPTLSPPVRGWHDAAYDLNRGRTVVFGGWDGSVLGDTWEWDGSAWMAQTPTAAPPPRCCHALTYDLSRGRVVLFGGAAGSGATTDMNDTWEWDGANWTQAQPAVFPAARRGPRIVYDITRGTVLLFGGGVTSGGSPVFNDTWEWDGVNWSMHSPAIAPPPRWSPCLVSDWTNNRVVMFGGSAGATLQSLGDTWTWDGIDWQQQSPATSPTGRRYAGGAFDLQRGVVVMFGGNFPPDPATWLWDGTDWRIDPRTPRPPQRSSFALAYDNARSRSVQFGGVDAGNNSINDTWEYDSSGMATWAAGGSGCAGPQGIPVLAPAVGSLPILGTTFTLELTYGAGNSLAVFLLGLSNTQWAGGGLPQGLAGHGMPGCQLRASPDAPAFTTLVGGTASLNWPLPVATAFAGIVIHAQGFVADPAANAAGAVLSNAGTVQTGVF